MNDSPKILIVAGEASGDLHGSRMVRQFKKIRPNAEIYGIGGDLMRNAGVRLIRHIRDMSTYGITEVFAHLPKLIRLFLEVLNSIRSEKPDVVVLVDYPDFNIRLARFIRYKYGATPKILYYIAPQVWIWRKHRAKVIAKLVDRLAVVLPFEKVLFENLGARVHFVGHPLLGVERDEKDVEGIRDPFTPGASPKIALMPGSRASELASYAPPLIEAAKTLKQKMPAAEFALIKAPTLDADAFAPYLNDGGCGVTLIDGSARQLLGFSDFAVVALGTATLEAALAGVPSVLVGKVSGMTFKLGMMFLGMDLEYYSLVNFILGRPAFPELIQDRCTGVEISDTVYDILNNDRALEALRNAAAEVRRRLEVESESTLAGSTASARTAAILDEMISELNK